MSGYYTFKASTSGPYISLLQEKLVQNVLAGQTITPDEGYNGLSKVIIESIQILLQNKTITPGAEAITVTADEGYDGLGQVIVEPGVPTLQSKTVESGTENITVEPDENYDGLSEVIVQPYHLIDYYMNSVKYIRSGLSENDLIYNEEVAT